MRPDISNEISGGDLDEKIDFQSVMFFKFITQNIIFSQKQTSWVFNDQPCECADVGHSRKIGRAAKIGWEKILLPAMIARSGATDPILSTQRIPRGRDPVFIYTNFFGAFLVRNC